MDALILADGDGPTRAELDKAAPRHPVAFRTGPDASLNSMALSKSGIDAKFQVPDGQPCRVERDRSGEPTGILRNCARYIRADSGGSSPTAEAAISEARRHHPYSNPAFLVLPVEAGAPDFLTWIAEQTRQAERNKE